MIVASTGIYTEGVQDPLISSTRLTEVSGTITDVNNFRTVLTVDGAGHGQLLYWMQWTFFSVGVILIVLSIILMFEGQVKGHVGRFFK